MVIVYTINEKVINNRKKYNTNKSEITGEAVDDMPLLSQWISKKGALMDAFLAVLTERICKTDKIGKNCVFRLISAPYEIPILKRMESQK